MGWREKGAPLSGGSWLEWRTSGPLFEPFGPTFVRRGGPWRGSHRCDKPSYHALRHMKTTQEHRAWDPRWSRAKRSNRNLVTVYDDLIRCTERSWKSHRETQYRPLE